MLLIEAPALGYRDPVEVHDVEDLVERLDGALEVGGIGLSEVEAVLLKQSPSLLCFLYALLRQVDIRPAREAVFLIPHALAVTDQYDSLHDVILILIVN